MRSFLLELPRETTEAAIATRTVGLAFAAIAAGGSAARSNAVAPGTASGTRHVLVQAARRPHHFQGCVLWANRSQGWFQMRTTRNASVRVYANRSTYWSQCDWIDMVHGCYLDVYAYRNHGTWMATRMQNWHKGLGMMSGWSMGCGDAPDCR